MLIAAVDVGSPKNIGWAIHDGPTGCGNLDLLVAEIAQALKASEPVSLGFEAPLWVPRKRAFHRMTANRGGIEARMSRPWSAGAGCGALAAGVANVAWVFEALNEILGAIRCTTIPSLFSSGEAELLVWEAFVSGNLKALTHEGDAELAVHAFVTAWPNLISSIPDEPSINLAASTILATGHSILLDELGRAGVVVAALDTLMKVD